MTTLEEFQEIDQMAQSINARLDAMYAKLGKIVVAVETVNEAVGNLSPAAITTQTEQCGFGGDVEP